jgi:hypothetical protein
MFLITQREIGFEGGGSSGNMGGSPDRRSSRHRELSGLRCSGWEFVSISPGLSVIDAKKSPFFVIKGRFWRKRSKNSPRGFDGLGLHP